MGKGLILLWVIKHPGNIWQITYDGVYFRVANEKRFLHNHEVFERIYRVLPIARKHLCKRRTNLYAYAAREFFLIHSLSALSMRICHP